MQLRTVALALVCFHVGPATASPRPIRIEMKIYRCRPNAPAELVSAPTTIALDGERSSMSRRTNGHLDFAVAVVPTIQRDGRISIELEHDVPAGTETDHFTAHRTIAAGAEVVVHGADLSTITLTARPI